jgi:hypothetical protein
VSSMDPELAALGEGDDHLGGLLDRLLGRTPTELAAVVDVDHQGVARVELGHEQQVLALDVAGDLGPLEEGRELLLVGVPGDQPGSGHLDGLDALPTDVAVEVSAKGLDLRLLSHALLPLVRGRRPRGGGRAGARPPRAAPCSACFFDRPEPDPTGSPSSTTTASNSLSCSGPCSVISIGDAALTGLGHQLVEPALVVGCSLGVEPRRHQPVHQGLGGGHAPVEVDGADHGLHGVGEDRRPLPARPWRASPLPSSRTSPMPRSEAISASAGAADHRGAHPRQLTLGRHRGCKDVDVVGDHEAEHRVAQELQALVGSGTRRVRRTRNDGSAPGPAVGIVEARSRGGREASPRPPGDGGIG